jgi:hypothetical protein
MVKAVAYGSDYEEQIASERKFVSEFIPPTKSDKVLWIKNSQPGQPPVQMTKIFELFQKWEGYYKPHGTPPESKGVPFYSLYSSLTGYIRQVKIIPADEKKGKKYSDIEFLIQDSEDGEFFKIKPFENSAASNNYCVNLNDPRADYSKPFTFYCKKKEDKEKKGEFYMNYHITQDHLPKTSWGTPGGLYLNVRSEFPLYQDRTTKKMLPDWLATEWGELAQFFDAKYTNLPVREGMIAAINDKAITAMGQPPTEAEIMQSLISTPAQPEASSLVYEESYSDDSYEEEEDLFANATVLKPAPQVQIEFDENGDEIPF